MIARAALAALAVLAGSLVTPLAAAEPPPPLAAPSRAESAPVAPAPPVDAAPAVAPPVQGPPSYAPPGYAPPSYAPPGYAPPGYAPPGYAPPGYAPPGYAPPGYAPPGYPPPSYAPPLVYVPLPMVWRDGTWQAASPLYEAPPRPPARDPMLTAGVVIGVAGLLTTAASTGWFIASGSSQEGCGLSGCITLPHRESRTSAAAMIAGGVSVTLFGTALAIAGARGPTPARRSHGRTVTGLVFTALGLGAASGSVMQALVADRRHSSVDAVYPDGFSRSASVDSSAPIVLALVASVSFAVGIPLWISGALSRPPPGYARVAATSLDLLPSVGGAALRWTR